MNRPVGEAIRKWRAYFSAYAALPGDIYFMAGMILTATKLARGREDRHWDSSS
jgi:hypothetical protein